MDFIEEVCNIDNINTIPSIGNSFCSFLSSKYSFEGNKCYKAEAADKTKHLLMPLEIILEVFLGERSLKLINHDFYASKINDILSKSYTIHGPTCCCCPKKLKKALHHAIAFSEFVRQGQVELRRFDVLRPRIEFLVSLDIEAFEHSVDKLLEFGLSVYNMSSKTTTVTHIIVTDYIYLRNGRFVADNRDKFNFGQSHFFSLNSAINQVLAAIMIPNSCLIGHNIKADIKYLKSVSVKNLDLPIFDTQIMYKQATLGEHFLGLVRVLDEIGIPHSNLHNAGNDAYYTLEVFKNLANL